MQRGAPNWCYWRSIARAVPGSGGWSRDSRMCKPCKRTGGRTLCAARPSSTRRTAPWACHAGLLGDSVARPSAQGRVGMRSVLE
eukprot:3014866-Prymnesium_polylepis.1